MGLCMIKSYKNAGNVEREENVRRRNKINSRNGRDEEEMV